MQLQPVILSGGSGTRLWPLSREAYPKQFLSLYSDQTMLQETALRCTHMDKNVEVSAPIVVCNEIHRFVVTEQLSQIDKVPLAVLLEPAGRNTAPALTLAALAADPDAILLVMPADHQIKQQDVFCGLLNEAMAHATAGRMVTFGIVPTHPETGYGYIKTGQQLDNKTAMKLERFVEKPDMPTAELYVSSGEYLWNSGIFVVSASHWLKLLGDFAPDILKTVKASFDDAEQDGVFVRPSADLFGETRSQSIDYAVMEPLTAAGFGASQSDAVVLPLDAGWSDLGAWDALQKTSEQDENKNVLAGDVYSGNSHDNFIRATSRFVAVLGVSNLVVVETPDAVLITDMGHAQDIKDVTTYLKQEGRSEHRFHRCVHRPWGSFEAIDAGPRYQVKRLTVNPGSILSLQMHHHRAEHWVVVSGTARVTCGEDVFLLHENQSTYISIGTKHRLENPGTIPLEIIEVQSGSYLGEDDIVRFDDQYNRTSND